VFFFTSNTNTRTGELSSFFVPLCIVHTFVESIISPIVKDRAGSCGPSTLDTADFARSKYDVIFCCV
jgi:hypothetical protein